ncbi:MAG: hypothetical protein ACK2UP_08265 [Candidatus Promineifilaceae bacterium]|jgi:hypothetical protein
MKAIQGLLAVFFLAAGIFLGTRLMPSRVDAQVPIQERLPANITGTTLIQPGEMLDLRAFSSSMPQDESLAFSNYNWKLNGKTISRESRLQTRLTRSGEYNLDLTFQDQYGQIYSYAGTVSVMQAGAYEDMMAAVGAAVRLMLAPDDDLIYLPLLTH